MTQRTGGARAKTRHKLRKTPRDKGKVSITKILQKFNEGDKVLLLQEPSVHKGMPHPKFRGKIGTIVKTQGKIYMVKIKDGNKTKNMLSAAVHLKLVK